MDWNKSKTILIISFIIANIFLFSVVYDYTILGNNYEAIDNEFIQIVKDELKQKNINVQCKIPKDLYSLPLLEVEYKTISIDDTIVKNFLGNNFEVIEDLKKYKNKDGKILEIKNNKQLVYNLRNPILQANYEKDILEKQLQIFLKEKNIQIEGFYKSREYQYNGIYVMIFNEKYDKYFIENTYIKIYFDKNGIYKFETQQAKNIIAKGKIKVTSAPESLLRLTIDNTIRSKNIIGIEMCFYTEEEEWFKIIKKNADPTWKVYFKDGTFQYLVEKD